MNSQARKTYFRNCKTPEPANRFGDFYYDGDEDDMAADLTDDELEDDNTRPPS